MKKYKKGDIVKGIVTGIEEYGAFVTFNDGYTGLVHISEISKGFVSDVNNYFKIGEETLVKVIDADNDEHKLRLSIKYRTKNEEKDLGIEEVGSGFLGLKNNLDNWINTKISEINEKNIKK